MELFPDFEYEPKPEPDQDIGNGVFPVVGREWMEELVALAVQLRNLEPWKSLDETDLISTIFIPRD